MFLLYLCVGLCAVFKAAKNGGVFSLKLYARLGSFHVEVCDDHCNIADIRIQGRYMFKHRQRLHSWAGTCSPR